MKADANVEKIASVDISSFKSLRKHELKAKVNDCIATVVIWLITLLSLSILAFIIGIILWKGVLIALDPNFVFGKPQAIRAGGGIGPMVVSSFYLAVLTLLFVLPVGIGAAIYMAEFAKEGWITKMARFGADTLSTVPSVVFGIFGMLLFVIHFGLGYSLMAGALTLAFLNLPTVMRTAEEAIRTVPHSYREASMGLGATKWQTIKGVVLPSAMPGIITGAILSVGRIIGESAAIVYTVGIYVRKIPVSPLDAGAPMAANIWHMYTEGALVSDWMRVANGEAALLLLVVLVLNLLARFLGWVYRKKRGVMSAVG